MKFDLWMRHLRIEIKTFFYRVYLWFKGHGELTNYAFFGVLATVVDWATSFALYRFVNYHVANVAAWIAAVLFAFFTNRSFVFHSRKKGALAVVGEFFGFAGGRLFSLSVQEMLFIVAVDVMGLSEYLVKIPVAVAVVVINFFISRYIFSDSSAKDGKTEQSSDTAPSADVRGRSILITKTADEKKKEKNDNETEL